jgi:sugar lactone lactonase YvrE
VEQLEDRAVPSVSIAIADTSMNEIGALSPLVTRGSGGLNQPKELVVGPDGNVYVASAGTNSVIRYTSTGQLLGNFVTAGSGGLSSPQVVAFGPDGNLYVSSVSDNNILEYNGSNGTFLRTFVAAGSGGLYRPYGMVFGQDGNLYVSSTGTESVDRFQGPLGSAPGSPLPAAGQSGATFVASGSGGLDGSSDLTFGPNGNLFVSNALPISGTTNNYGVLEFDATTGAFITTYVGSNYVGIPRGLAYDQEGRLYVADFATNAIHRFDNQGKYLDDPVTSSASSLQVPIGMVFDAQGRLLISSRDTNAIARYDRGVTVTLSQASTSPVSVNYATSDVTAKAGTDYTGQTGTLTFAPGQTTRTILLVTQDHTVFKPNETFTVQLSNPTGGATIGTGKATVTILDSDVADDLPPVNIAVTPATIPSGGTATVTLTAKDTAANPLPGLPFTFGWSASGFLNTGSGSFGSVTDNHDGSYTATFTGTTAGLASGITITASLLGQPIASNMPVITVIPAVPASQLAITNLTPASVSAGSPVSFTVTAEDSTGAPVPSYTGTVHFTSSDLSAVLPSDYTFTSSDNGTHTFTVTLQSAGSQSLTVTDQANTSLTATTGPITVNGGSAKFLVSIPSGNTIVVGDPFLVTVQAVDASGNPVANYSGPTNVTFSSSPPDPQKSFTATLNSSGYGFFLGNLKTAGSYTLTATAGTVSGTSSSLTVIPSDASYFTVKAPAAAIAGNSFNVTVTAYDHFGNIATGYTGTVKLASSDPALTLIGSYTFTTGLGKDNGVHTFSATLKTGGSQTVTATDALATNPAITGTSSTITARGLTVTGFTPTATGFTVSFSKPIVPATIYLYGGTIANPIQNVTLVGQKTASSFGPVNGSLVIDASGTSATFKASSDWLQNVAGQSNGLLPNDTWTVTLQSGIGPGTNANGFFDALGAPLDGGNNGGHADFTTTFTTANDGKPALTIPDFARGPDGSATIKVPNNSAHGIPVTLANAPAGTTDVVFTLNYDPALITPTGARTGDSTGAGSTFTMAAPSNGQATFTWHNSAGISGDIVLGDILASLPSSAANRYHAKELLTLTSISVNGVAFTGVTSPAMHVSAYFGDLSDDGQITGLDLAMAGNAAAGTPTSPVGLSAYRLVDPGLIGDIGSDGAIDSAAISSLAAYLAHVNTPGIPSPPAGLTIAPSGPDPTLSLGTVGRIGNPSYVTVPVLLDNPHPDGSTGMTEAIVGLTYDPKVLSVAAADITLGAIPASGSGWRLEAVVDQLTGQIAIDLYSATPITETQAGSLVSITFHVLPGVIDPVTNVRLVSAVTTQDRGYETEVADAAGQLVLSPGVDDVVIATAKPLAFLPSGRRPTRVAR